MNTLSTVKVLFGVYIYEEIALFIYSILHIYEQETVLMLEHSQNIVNIL